MQLHLISCNSLTKKNPFGNILMVLNIDVRADVATNSLSVLESFLQVSQEEVSLWRCNQNYSVIAGVKLQESMNKKRKRSVYELRAWLDAVSLKNCSNNALKGKPLLSHTYFICTLEL